ncbi:MAG: formylglycine-generating enzyme family protein [Rhodospirillales bacterium]
MARLSFCLLFLCLAAWAAPLHARRPTGQVFRDCQTCPEMVVVPPGTFQMGSTVAETTREHVPNEYAFTEKPVHTVSIPKAVAVGKFAVTRAEFSAFSRDTGHDPSGCWYWDATAKEAALDEKRGWKDPGFLQTGLTQPVVCVSWDDAQRYAKWLSGKTGQTYRLPTEAEWEYAARAGTATAHYWGDAIGLGNTNCGYCGSQWDGVRTAPSGSFRPNAFGLYDMLGNAWQWTMDCWAENYYSVPNNGSKNTIGDCKYRVLRGGSWSTIPSYVRAANRYWDAFDNRLNNAGFRVARTLP